MVAVPEHGRLDEVPLPRLLLDLYRARYGGSLTLSRDRVGKRFLFQEGVPVFAESNLASESLGVQLMDRGRISRADYNRVVRHIERKQCKEGTALLDLKLLEPKALFVALKDQVRIRIIECFGWPHGEFYVDPSSEPPADAQPFRADVYSLLQEGIEAHWSSDRIISDLEPNMQRYPRRGRRFDRAVARLHQDPAVQALTEALDGTRTLWKVVQAASTPRALAAAWVLDATAALEYGDQPARSSQAPGDVDVDVDVEIVIDDAKPSTAPSPAQPAAAGPGSERKAPVGHDQAEALRREIAEKFERLEDLDCYALLGVVPTAEASDIKRAYHQAAKTYHPDALARSGLDAEAREKANKVFAEIGKAHAVLSDPERRRDYDAVRATRDTDLDANRLAQAETLFRKAQILLQQGNFKGALEFLQPAVDLWPEECTYQSALGWALYKKPPSEPEAALEHLERAQRIDPNDPETEFRLGIVRRSLGRAE
jgi:tetratricopeptide (TPR) repeat protein